jgi:hypothetical protein
VSEVSCYKCGVTICLANEASLRRDHGAFYCPNGHQQYFSGKTDAEKKIEVLEQRVARFRSLWEESMQEAGRCPWPKCPYRSRARTGMRLTYLRRHIASKHDVPLTKRLEAVS